MIHRFENFTFNLNDRFRMSAKCTSPGCSKWAFANGLCSLHKKAKDEEDKKAMEDAQTQALKSNEAQNWQEKLKKKKPKMVDVLCCWYCKKPIEGKVLKAMDHSFHPECLVCVDCNADFNENFYTRNGQPYCAECYGKRGGGCAECGNSMGTETALIINGKKYHKDCFLCSRCRTKIEGTKYKFKAEEPGTLICHSCAAELEQPQEVMQES